MSEAAPSRGRFFFSYLSVGFSSLAIITGLLPNLQPLEEHITALMEPIIDDLGFELVRIRITGSQTKTLQIMAERPDGTMTAEDCATLSRALSPVFEEADPIEERYILEVSSPGIDRPLTRDKDFLQWEGHEARLELDRMVEGRKRFKGILAGFENGHVAFDIDGEEETALFPRDWIKSAKLVLTDALIRESLKRSGTDSNDVSANGDAI